MIASSTRVSDADRSVSNTTVRDVMTPDLLTIAASASVEEALALMAATTFATCPCSMPGRSSGWSP